MIITNVFVYFVFDQNTNKHISCQIEILKLISSINLLFIILLTFHKNILE